MVDLAISNLTDSSVGDRPIAFNLRISVACPFVSLARTLLSPFGRMIRPLLNPSSMLSLCDPRNRCPGFTQNPLSQWWQTYKSPIGSERNRNQDARWASMWLPATEHMPYRLWLPMAPFQIQHPVLGSGTTYRMNRAMTRSFRNVAFWPFFMRASIAP